MDFYAEEANAQDVMRNIYRGLHFSNNKLINRLKIAYLLYFQPNKEQVAYNASNQILSIW
jgi:hypothetical protein